MNSNSNYGGASSCREPSLLGGEDRRGRRGTSVSQSQISAATALNTIDIKHLESMVY